MFEWPSGLRISTRIFYNIMSLFRLLFWCGYHHTDVQNHGERLWTSGMTFHVFTWGWKNKSHLSVTSSATGICCDMTLYPVTLLPTYSNPIRLRTVRQLPAPFLSTVHYWRFFQKNEGDSDLWWHLRLLAVGDLGRGQRWFYFSLFLGDCTVYASLTGGRLAHLSFCVLMILLKWGGLASGQSLLQRKTSLQWKQLLAFAWEAMCRKLGQTRSRPLGTVLLMVHCASVSETCPHFLTRALPHFQKPLEPMGGILVPPASHLCWKETEWSYSEVSGRREPRSWCHVKDTKEWKLILWTSMENSFFFFIPTPKLYFSIISE